MSLIEFVHGKLVERAPDSVVVAVGGFGVRVLAPGSTINAMPEPGSDVTLLTHFVVREDAMTLYGFATKQERAVFNQLLSVTGVGPSTALGALSSQPADRLAGAIAVGDVDALSRIRGIGKKTAQRIILDLKGKLVTPMGDVVAPAAANGVVTNDVLQVTAEALRQFGFSPQEVRTRLESLPQDRTLTEDEAVRLAFQYSEPR